MKRTHIGPFKMCDIYLVLCATWTLMLIGDLVNPASNATTQGFYVALALVMFTYSAARYWYYRD